MRPHLSHCRILALLLALSLPLQGFAAVGHCARPPASNHVHAQSTHAHEHCADATEHATKQANSERATQGSATLPHHGCCTDCCLAAMTQMNTAWTPPRAETLALSLPAQRATVVTSLDRLDRPPRTTPV